MMTTRRRGGQPRMRWSVVGVAVALACTPDGPGISVSDEMLESAPAQDSAWLTYGRDYANSRYVPSTAIDSASVTGLRVAWQRETKDAAAGNQTTPLVIGGLLYYTLPPSTVIARDAGTGRERWRYTHRLDSAAYQVLCCGPVNRGLGAYDTLLYYGTLDAHLVALDRRTGRVRWSRRVASPAEGYSITMAPLAAGGRVIVGVSGGEYPTRGFVDAYDARTGAPLWRFWTIPTPEEGGWWGSWRTTSLDGIPLPRDIAREKADSARYADAWRTGGGGVWTTPAYDPSAGMLYFGVGNPAPSFDGTRRPGDNLYTASIVAVRIADGRLAWYSQLVPHDIWDFDAASPVVLFDLDGPTGATPALAHASKNGRVYVLDRRSGALLSTSEPLVPNAQLFAPPLATGDTLAPGPWGGVTWSPAAYSPRTGLLYVRAMHAPVVLHRAEAGDPQPAVKWQGGGFDELSRDSTRSVLVAVSPGTGRIVWRLETPHSQFGGGVLATAGDLVFFSDQRGTVHAVDARTGVVRWQHVVKDFVSAPPIAFRVDGREYLLQPTMSRMVAFTLP